MSLHSSDRALARTLWRTSKYGVVCTALLIAWICTPVAARSQQPDLSPGRPLLLTEVYGELRSNSPQVLAAQALARAADARIPGATRPPDPQLQLGFMNRELPGLAPMATLGMTQLQVMQMIPLGGKLTAAGDVARGQASVADARADDVLREQLNKSAMIFYDLFAIERTLEVTRETLRLLGDIALTAESMYRVGDGRQSDVLRAQVAIARMVEDTLSMQAMYESMVAKLGALLNRSGTVVFGTPLLPAFPDSVPDRTWLDSIARVDRPMVRAEMSAVRASEAAERLARKDIIPDLAVGLQYGQRGATGGTDRMGSLMLGMSIPIFARSRQYKMRDEASAMRLMAEGELAAVRAETRGGIGEAYAALQRARRLSALYRTTVLPQAEATVTSSMAAYRVGTVDFMTLLDSRMLVNKYQQDFYQLQADEGKAWAELEMFTGTTLLNATTRQPNDDASSTRNNP